MKLSELSTDRAADVMCELTPYIANIVSDEALTAELRAAASKDAVTKAELIADGLDKINRLVPIVLKKLRADVYGILSAVNEKSAEEIAQQNIIRTMMQIREIAKDKELLDFFKSCADSQGSV